MQKIFSLIAIILLASVASPAQAQTRKTSTQKNSTGVSKPAVVRLGPPTTYLKNGLSTDEVVRLLGDPESVSERRHGDSSIATCVFARNGGRVLVAEFVNGRLINSRTETRENLVRADMSGN
jgi:hypothetical protein